MLDPAPARTIAAEPRFAASTAIALLLATTPARAADAPPRARAHVAADLSFTIADDAGTCPAEALLHDEIARRIGYDPFTRAPAATPFGRVRVAVARTPAGLRATYAHEDPAGTTQWTRTYEVPGAGRASCETLASGLGALLAVPISTFARRAPLEREITDEPALLAPEPPPSPPDPAPPPARPSRPRFEAALAAFVAGGTAPRANLGGALHLGVRAFPFATDRAHLSFAVEARVDAPSARADGVRTQLVAGSVATCAHREIASGPHLAWIPLACAIGTAGVVRGAWRDHPELPSSSAPFLAGGIRAGLEARLSPTLALRAQGDLALTLHTAAIMPAREGRGAVRVTGNGGIAAVISF